MVKKERTDDQRYWPWWRWFIMGLNTAALVLATILSWHYLRGGAITGCDGGSSCGQILSSRWSSIAGILPVSGLALGVYFAMLVAGFFIGPATEVSIRRLAWSAMLVLAGSVAGSAIWFIIVQKWIVGEFCIYCMTAHIIGLLLSALVVWRSTKEFRSNSKDISYTDHTMIKNGSAASVTYHTTSPLRTIGLTLSGLVLAGILAAAQFGFTPNAIYSKGESRDTLSVIDYHTAPVIGSPDAPYMVRLLFDYQCPHCQKIHFMLDEAVHRYDGKMAFVLCPTPLNAQCNSYIPEHVNDFKNSCELAKIGLAVWKADPKMFSTFENWMFTFESGDSWHPRSIENTRAKAVELVGKADFDKARTDPWIEQYMQTCVRIYGQTIQSGNGAVPKLFFGSQWVIPEANNTEELILILQKSLGLPKS